MRYFQEQTLNFWKVGYRLFHGKFLRFMAGPSGSGQVVSGEHQQGDCSALNSRINFAVPSKSTLNEDKLIPLYPGVFTESMKTLSENLGSKVIKLGIDGKKIARGKGSQAGDIDCWGFEQVPTLKDRKIRLEKELEMTSIIYHFVESFVDDDKLKAHIPNLKENLIEIIMMISERLKDLREVGLKLTRLIKKLLKMGEVEKGNWKNSRFAPAISSLKVNKYDVDQAIETALRLNNNLCTVIATLNEQRHVYSESGLVDLKRQGNYYQLKAIVDCSDSQYVKQRSEEWHKIRKKAAVTGSTCNNRGFR